MLVPSSQHLLSHVHSILANSNKYSQSGPWLHITDNQFSIPYSLSPIPYSLAAQEVRHVQGRSPAAGATGHVQSYIPIPHLPYHACPYRTYLSMPTHTTLAHTTPTYPYLPTYPYHTCPYHTHPIHTYLSMPTHTTPTYPHLPTHTSPYHTYLPSTAYPYHTCSLTTGHACYTYRADYYI